MEAVPGRVFHDFDTQTELGPLDVMQRAGFNAARIQTFMKDECSTTFDNSGDVLRREMYFQLDFGGIDIGVKAAQLAKQRNMKVIHTVNLGEAIPEAWLGYSYKQMLEAIDGEVRRQVAPFLQAGIQADVVLLENEGSSGCLYNIKLPSGETYSRGVGKYGAKEVPLSQLQKEVAGQQPT